MNKRIALFPGSFDPFTKGHEDIVLRGLQLFDEIIVAIGNNSEKNYLFNILKREKWIKEVFANNKKISVLSYKGLTIDLCKKVHAKYIIRGLRTSADFEFERGIAQMNRAMTPDIESVFVITDPALSALSSTIVRDIIRNQGDVSMFVPENIKVNL